MATKQARWGISFQNIFSLAKPICNNCFSNSFYFLIKKIIWLFSRFLCCFVVFVYSFSRSFVSFIPVYFLVSRPRVAKVLCFIRWTEQIHYLFFYFNLSKTKTVTCLPGLLAITLVSCFAWLSSHLLFCYASSYSIHVQSFLFHQSVSNYFSPFFVLWILLASQPRLARVSCFIRRAERTRSPVGIHGCKYRLIFSDNRHCHSFLQGVFLWTACSSCCTYWRSPKMVEMLISS